MPTTDHSRDHAAPFFGYPLSGAVSRNFGLTAPATSRPSAPNRALRPSAAIGAAEPNYTAPEDLWDLLGDFA